MTKDMLSSLKATVEEPIKDIIKDGVNTNNLDYLYKLIDIHKDVANEEYWIKKEEREMYEAYGRRPGYSSYGEYGNYGRRGYDMKYRGDEYLDRMAGEYGRYSANRSSYGASEETDKSFHYMLKALEDFIKVLHEEVNTPQQKQMLRETIQRSMM